jgi:hypothetical protein
MRPLILLAALAATALADPRTDLKSATLAGAPAAHHKAIEFLIDHMPERDVATLEPAFLRDNVALAYQARDEFPWAGEVPEEIFFNDVVPYAVVDEARGAWRADFLQRFRKHAAGAKTVREAIIRVNGAIARETGVQYSTRRRAPNQGPAESMKLKMASCTGLSILLVDALRAVGLPARLTGTAMWTTKQGNHNWVEVWLPETKSWQFTEYGGGPKAFDRGWVVADAARAIPGSLAHGVYSTSWRHTGSHFPMVWDMRDHTVPAVEVSQRYIDLGQATLPAIGECELRIEVMAEGESGSQARRPLDVKVLQGDVQVASGKSPTQTDDMNQFLTIKVRQGQLYQLVAFRDGRPAAIERIEVKGKEADKKITLQVKG